MFHSGLTTYSYGAWQALDDVIYTPWEAADDVRGAVSGASTSLSATRDSYLTAASDAWGDLADTARSYADQLPLVAGIAAAAGVSSTIVAAGATIVVTAGVIHTLGYSPNVKAALNLANPAKALKGLF